MWIWNVDSDDLERLQGHDQRFTEILNNLIVRQAQTGSLPDSALRLNLKTRAPDGGVDAAVDRSIPSTGGSGGYFDDPTCWQYKACLSGHIKPSQSKRGGQQVALAEEINKPETRELINSGYGYRFCIADDLNPPQISRWEGWLNAAAKKIRADARPAIVLPASRLVLWINRYAGLVRTLRTDLGRFRDFATWKDDVQHPVKHFYQVAAWADKLQSIREFADFTRIP